MQPTGIALDEKHAEPAAAILSAMANPTRFETLGSLLKGKSSVALSAIISHIDAQTTYYSLNSSAVRKLIRFVNTINPSPSR